MFGCAPFDWSLLSTTELRTFRWLATAPEDMIWQAWPPLKQNLIPLYGAIALPLTRESRTGQCHRNNYRYPFLLISKDRVFHRLPSG